MEYTGIDYTGWKNGRCLWISAKRAGNGAEKKNATIVAKMALEGYEIRELPRSEAEYALHSNHNLTKEASMTTITCGGTMVITDDGRVFDLPKKPGESVHIPSPGNLRVMTPEEIERLEKTRPRSYDLSLQEDRDRLLRETAGYAKVSLHHGTDNEGRRYASEALDRALRMGFRLVLPDAT